MNTGEIIETKNLLLKPSNNATDNDPFIRMLREDNDFESFCGLPFTNEYLDMFVDYFEHNENEECLYSIYSKDGDAFLGYIGFHRENEKYELEFYIGKDYRQKGLCEEACRVVINKLFNDGLSVDGNTLVSEKVYATTIADNVAAKSLLKKLGFIAQEMFDAGAILVAQGFYDEETDEFHTIPVSKYVINNKQFNR